MFPTKHAEHKKCLAKALMQMLSFAINLNFNNFLTAHHVKINKDSAQQIHWNNKVMLNLIEASNGVCKYKLIIVM